MMIGGVSTDRTTEDEVVDGLGDVGLGDRGRVGAQRLDLDLEAGVGRGQHAEALAPRSGSTQCSQLRGVIQSPWTRTTVSGRSFMSGSSQESMKASRSACSRSRSVSGSAWPLPS